MISCSFATLSDVYFCKRMYHHQTVIFIKNTHLHRNKQKCSLLIEILQWFFMTKVWLNLGMMAACKNMIPVFYVCLRYIGITRLASKWMLLRFGRGYNNQVTVAFCSSDVTKHVSNDKYRFVIRKNS